MPDRLLTGMDLCRLLVDAFGLGDQRVRRIVVDADVRDAATITVYAYVPEGPALQLVERVKRYQLAETSAVPEPREKEKI